MCFTDKWIQWSASSSPVQPSGRVGSGRVGLREGGATFILILEQWFRQFYELTLNYV